MKDYPLIILLSKEPLADETLDKLKAQLDENWPKDLKRPICFHGFDAIIKID